MDMSLEQQTIMFTKYYNTNSGAIDIITANL